MKRGRLSLPASLCPSTSLLSLFCFQPSAECRTCTYQKHAEYDTSSDRLAISPAAVTNVQMSCVGSIELSLPLFRLLVRWNMFHLVCQFFNIRAVDDVTLFTENLLCGFSFVPLNPTSHTWIKYPRLDNHNFTYFINLNFCRVQVARRPRHQRKSRCTQLRTHNLIDSSRSTVTTSSM